MDKREYERSLAGENKRIIGIDEVGRGPLAGPVVACAIIMKQDSNIEGVKDSKKLTEKKREMLYDQILSEAIFYGIGMIEATKIDEVNILNATFLAMKEAYTSLRNTENTLILVDGNMKIKGIEAEQIPIVKGDDKCYSIACASIIAKVTRDRLMNQYHEQYPIYDFIKNKGYGTQKHIEAIKSHGVIEQLHRKSFIKNFI